jgi:hypothetical protein
MNDLRTCDFYSLYFDESTHVAHNVQLAIINRLVFSDNSKTDEILTVTPLKGKNERRYLL